MHGQGSTKKPSHDLVCEDCGACYTNQRHLTAHEREHCRGSKRALSRLLGQAKEVWNARKRRKTEQREQAKVQDAASQSTSSVPIAQETRISEPLASFDSAMEPNPGVIDLPISARKGTRSRRPPLRYQDDAGFGVVSEEGDILPEPLPPMNIPDLPVQLPEIAGSTQNIQATTGGDKAQQKRWWHSLRNNFSLWRRYYAERPPVRDPERAITAEDLDDSQPARNGRDPETVTNKQYGPCDSISSLLLADFWWNSENEKSKGELSKLLKVLKDPDFSLEDVVSTDWGKLESTLSDSGDGDGWFDDAGWVTTEISISVPFHKRSADPGTKRRVVGSLQHRKVTAVIEDKIRNATDPLLFHYQPYEVYWSPDDESPAVRVQGELYNSPAFIEAHQRLQDRPPIPGCSRERVVIALMFWSDETHLTSFGSAKIWPCYMFFGNESKYRRGKTSLRLCEHIAYFEKLSDDFKDYLRMRNGGNLPAKDFMTHCRREIFHEQWRILLDDELLEAMKNGIVILCHDGIERRFFPVPFTYSADYPEKTRIAAIKQNGTFPCTRCLIRQDQVQNMGTVDDKALRQECARQDDLENQAMIKNALHDATSGLSVVGKAVDKHLKDRSLLPVENAFLSKLGAFGFNIYDALVVDLLHEVEIGVWKSLYQHLLRLLEAFEKRELLAELNERYREIPAFGRDTIRKFATNASETSFKAARDYEDLLQYSMPVFESLMPDEHNEIVMDLLFLFCQWHGLAKLRLHHDLTLQLLEETTVLLGSQFLELQSEADRRSRKTAAKGTDSATPGEAKGSTSRQPKSFSLNTPKYHSLGHYAGNIRRFGTTDSFSSEIGESNHPDVKTWYKRTNRRSFPSQIAGVERRRARLRRLRAALRKDRQEGVDEDEGGEPDGSIPVQAQYHIGSSNIFENLNIKYVNTHGLDDPALRDFIPKLKKHLLPRIQKLLAPHLYSTADGETLDVRDTQWGEVELYNNRVYSHKTMRVKYTTYDVRRGEDLVRLESKPNVMVLGDKGTSSSSPDDPYRYACVLGIFHADVMFLGELRDGTRNYHSHRIDFLWVRWYRPESQRRSLRLQRIQFEPSESPSSFGFLDPRQVVRGVHLLPCFSAGRAPRTVSVWMGPKQGQWKIYYVNRYASFSP